MVLFDHSHIHVCLGTVLYASSSQSGEHRPAAAEALGILPEMQTAHPPPLATYEVKTLRVVSSTVS